MVDSDYYMDPDLPEAEPLWHMSQSMDHRPLLAHPVITSFLCLKWRRIRPYFYTNLFLYSLFLVCLTSYLLMMTLNKVPSIYHVIILRRIGGRQLSPKKARVYWEPCNPSKLEADFWGWLNSQYFWKWTNPMKIFRQPASHPKLLIGSKLSLD